MSVYLSLVSAFCFLSLCIELRKLRKKIQQLEEENNYLKSKINYHVSDF